MSTSQISNNSTNFVQDDFLLEDLEGLEFLDGDMGTREERVKAVKFLLKQAEKSKDRNLRIVVLGYKSKFLDPRVTKKEVMELFYHLWEKLNSTLVLR